MPTFMDIYYHLSVMLGFNEAGGFVSNAFWEFAPAGRPHLYPPLMHLLMLIFYKFGFSVLTIARLFEFIIYPITVITLWWASEKLFSSRMAFFTTLISLSVCSFYLSIKILIPSTLAMILAMLSFVFWERKRILASSLLLGLSFYAHAITPWLFLSIFILYSLFNEKVSKDGFKVVLFGLIVALPILFYQFNNRDYLNLSVTLKELPIEINLWLLLLFIPGLLISFRRRGRYSFFIALFIIHLVSTFSLYRYRFISGQGVIGFLLLSSVALDRGYGRLVNFLDKKPWGNLDAIFVFILILLCFLVFSPTILIHEDGFGFKIL
ncbi:MAG: hypothetical protein FJZ11_01050, partial [Candidatus Omnitrophica bacterium]|nr:hypothetical protein [Candidatus Omnitrophota bacterium]